MKTLICLALCALVVSATSPIENLSSALELLDMQDLLSSSGHDAFDLTSSFTYIAGSDGSESSDSSDSDGGSSEKLYIRGNYNLITFKDGQSKIKTGDFNKTKDLNTQGPVNITGSGTFSARGGGPEKKGYFNGGSSTDFTFNSDSGFVFGIREHIFSGEFKDKKHHGSGAIEVNAWQDVNKSSNFVEYKFQGAKDADFELYSGFSKAKFDTVTDDKEEYKSYLGTVFHAQANKEGWSASGHYKLDVFNSDGKEVYNKSGPFQKNSTFDDTFGTYSAITAWNNNDELSLSAIDV